MPRMKVPAEVYDRIAVMLANGTHYRAIAKRVGFSTSTVLNVAKGRIKRQGRPLPSITEVLGPVKTTVGDPSPEEIAEACEKLRRLRPRERHNEGRWTAPEVRSSWAQRCGGAI